MRPRARMSARARPRAGWGTGARRNVTPRAQRRIDRPTRQENRPAGQRVEIRRAVGHTADGESPAPGAVSSLRAPSTRHPVAFPPPPAHNGGRFRRHAASTAAAPGVPRNAPPVCTPHPAPSPTRAQRRAFSTTRREHGHPTRRLTKRPAVAHTPPGALPHPRTTAGAFGDTPRARPQHPAFHKPPRRCARPAPQRLRAYDVSARTPRRTHDVGLPPSAPGIHPHNRKRPARLTPCGPLCVPRQVVKPL